ncbi:addiction module toxin, HicA family [Candidatus Peregrinibacteria bacterium]|jgi:predicted RNA binding protein YcfA (HicA-like mRNA interferase family)|nr:addiction module toxin, HicA family [Candidatus Peregrinibacteria bacterium]
MPQLKIISPKNLIKYLHKKGFQEIRQSGSHVFMEKNDITTIVPLHTKDLGRGIIRKILRDTDIPTNTYMKEV